MSYDPTVVAVFSYLATVELGVIYTIYLNDRIIAEARARERGVTRLLRTFVEWNINGAYGWLHIAKLVAKVLARVLGWLFTPQEVQE